MHVWSLVTPAFVFSSHHALHVRLDTGIKSLFGRVSIAALKSAGLSAPSRSKLALQPHSFSMVPHTNSELFMAGRPQIWLRVPSRSYTLKMLFLSLKLIGFASHLDLNRTSLITNSICCSAVGGPTAISEVHHSLLFLIKHLISIYR